MKNKQLLCLFILISISGILPAQVIRHAPGVARVPVNAVTTYKVVPNATGNNGAANAPASTNNPAPATANPAAETPPQTTTTSGQDKDDMIEIAGMGGTSFTAFNNYDGSPASYNQMQQISIGLIPVLPGGSYNFSLIFYSPTENISEAAFYDQGVLNIYFPLSMYGDIKEKFTQYLNDKRKIYIRVIQKANGYREGSLIF